MPPRGTRRASRGAVTRSARFGHTPTMNASNVSPLARPLTGIAIALVAMIGASLWAERNVGPDLLPHGFCFTWIPALLWLHVLGDALIGLAYVSIPITLWVFVRRRTDLPFDWVFLLFALFIISCGFTHFLSIWNVWNPDYWLSGSVKAFTAAASVATAGALVGLVPRALALPTVEALRAAKESLEHEVARRQAIEAQLRQAQSDLERRVEERTRELAAATALAESERARAEAARHEAEEANRSKDEFIAMLSHELRNPLAPIANAHRVLEQHAPPSPQARRALSIAARQLAHMKRLVDDLLDAARLIRGRIDLRRAPVELARIVRDALDSVAQPVAQREQRIDVSLPAAPVVLHADGARMMQVVENLLSNASKFTDPGETIELSATDAGDRVVIEVRDPGIGIAAADLPRLFRLFSQVDVSLDRSRSGLGIGLALVRQLVELHGGRVEASSDGVGRGSTFRVTLPKR
jgi:signal transduction histidine kinase